MGFIAALLMLVLVSTRSRHCQAMEQAIPGLPQDLRVDILMQMKGVVPVGLGEAEALKVLSLLESCLGKGKAMVSLLQVRKGNEGHIPLTVPLPLPMPMSRLLHRRGTRRKRCSCCYRSWAHRS